MNFYKVVLAVIAVLGGGVRLQASEKGNHELEEIRDSLYYAWPTLGDDTEGEANVSHRREQSFTEYDLNFEKEHGGGVQEKTENYMRQLYEELQNPESQRRLLDRIDRCIEHHPEDIMGLSAYKKCISELSSFEDFWASCQALLADYPELFGLNPTYQGGRVISLGGILDNLIPEGFIQKVNEIIFSSKHETPSKKGL